MKYFIEDGVYMRAGDTTRLYICKVEAGIAKLVEYLKNDAGYCISGNKYFLSLFGTPLTEFKSIMIDPDNYEQVGKLGINFSFNNSDMLECILG